MAPETHHGERHRGRRRPVARALPDSRGLDPGGTAPARQPAPPGQPQRAPALDPEPHLAFRSAAAGAHHPRRSRPPRQEARPSPGSRKGAGGLGAGHGLDRRRPPPGRPAPGRRRREPDHHQQFQTAGPTHGPGGCQRQARAFGPSARTHGNHGHGAALPPPGARRQRMDGLFTGGAGRGHVLPG